MLPSVYSQPGVHIPRVRLIIPVFTNKSLIKLRVSNHLYSTYTGNTNRKINNNNYNNTRRFQKTISIIDFTRDFI